MGLTINSEVGRARQATLQISGKSIETPAFLPVVNFYAGGRERALFGGGIYRTVKEFLIGDERIGGKDYSHLFPGTMMSISSLFDYDYSTKKIEYYLQRELREWAPFSSYQGLLFVDSGGFKFMESASDHSFFSNVNQEYVYDIQHQIGGDLIVNLDYPISPKSSYEERQSRAQDTIDNAVRLLELVEEYDETVFLTLHGYTRGMIERFLETTMERLGGKSIDDAFAGFALGSLVPFKDNYGKLIEAVSGAKAALRDYELNHLPLHILGISSAAIPLLSAVGADSFDSATYVYSAINGRYHTSLFDAVPLSDADFDACECQVCQNDELVAWMEGDAEYQKDILGPVAIHNLATQQADISRLRSAIRTGERDALVAYLEEHYGGNDRLRRFAYRVINMSLDEYFG